MPQFVDEIRTYHQEQVDSVCAQLGLTLLVAFGSRVSGEPPPAEHSDLDLAVLDPSPYSWSRFRDVYGALSDVFRGSDVDLALLGQADPLFRYETFCIGERLYGSPLLYCEQESYAYKAYADSADLRDLERALYDRKLEYIDDRLNGLS